MEEKKFLRKKYSEIRKNICNKKEKDLIIAEKFLNGSFLKSADCVLMYASFGSEIDTWNITRMLWDRNIETAFPRCGKDGIMTFHTVNSADELKEGMYGIREPDISLPQPEITENTVCLVPGLAFTEDGGRLGYGGGYYDRFLNSFPFVKRVSVAYEELFAESLPIMSHDLKTDYIVTQERTVMCNV